MINKVILYPSIDAVLYKEGNDDGAIWRCSLFDTARQCFMDRDKLISFVLDSGVESIEFEADLKEINDLSSRFEYDSRRFQALDFAVFGLNATLTENRRSEVMQAFEQRAEDKRVADFVTCRFLSTPAVEREELTRAYELATSARCERLRCIYGNALDYEEEAARVRSAINKLIGEGDGSTAERVAVMQILIDNGELAKCVTELAEKGGRSLPQHVPEAKPAREGSPAALVMARLREQLGLASFELPTPDGVASPPETAMAQTSARSLHPRVREIPQQAGRLTQWHCQPP